MSNAPDKNAPRLEGTAEASRLEELHPRLMRDMARSLTDREQAGFFFSAIDVAPDALIVHRPDGTLIYANSEAASLLGYEQRELLDLPPYSWVAPSQLQAGPRRIERILSDGTHTFESGARRKDGTSIPTEVRSRRVDTPLGTVIVAVIRDISTRVQNREMLEHLAYHDSLTGLSNRIHLEDRLALAIADARRYGDDLAMAYVDLDRFKPVNDQYGHAAGDEVLVQVAHRLRDGVREQDTVARLGGDEFVILFPRLTSREEIETVAERLVSSLTQPMQVDEHTIRVEASIGLAWFDRREDDARSLLVKADKAMYSAKVDPEHSWLLYHEGMRLAAEQGAD